MAISIKISEARDEYLDHLEARGLAAGTRRTRRDAINLLVRAVGDIQVQNLKAEHMDRLFMTYNWAASTRNVKRSMYAQFFSFCRNRRYMGRDHDPLFGWRSLTVPKTNRLRIPVTEWGRLFSACEYPTERAVLGLGLFLFLRSSEIKALRVRDVHLDNNYIDVYRQKTKEHDRMPISTELETILRAYLRWYTQTMIEQGEVLQPEHFLVPPRKVGTCLKVDGRYIANTGEIDPTRPHAHPHRVVQAVLTRCGYEVEGNREGGHTLRRSGARAYFDELAGSGYDGALRRVQAMLGHKTSNMTETYLGLDLDLKARNDLIEGKAMFPSLQAGNVVPLREAQ